MRRALFISLILTSFIIITSCASPLKEYKRQNDDEK